MDAKLGQVGSNRGQSSDRALPDFPACQGGRGGQQEAAENTKQAGGPVGLLLHPVQEVIAGAGT